MIVTNPWTPEMDAMLIEMYNTGAPHEKIREELVSKTSVPRTYSSVSNRLLALRRKGLVSSRRPEKKKNTTKKARGESVPSFWSEEETARMFFLIAKGFTYADTAAKLSAEFNTPRTAAKVTSRLTWLKTRAKKNPARTKPPAALPALAPTQTQTTSQVAEVGPEKTIRLTYPHGALTVTVMGDLPKTVRSSLGALLLERL